MWLERATDVVGTGNSRADPTSSSLWEDDGLHPCRAVSSAWEHGTRASSREATRTLSLRGGEGYLRKCLHASGMNTCPSK